MPRALFLPCTHRSVFPADGEAQRRLLARCGVEGLPLLDAFCCGQPAATAGDRNGGAEMSRGWLEAASRFDEVFVASATCAGHLLAHGVPPGKLRYVPDTYVDALPGRSSRPPVRVYLHRPCHDVWPDARWRSFERWLAETASVEVLERPYRDACCGFGGVFSTLFDETAAAMIAHRQGAIAAAGASAIVSAEPGCLSHFAAHRREVPVVPLATFLVERGLG